MYHALKFSANSTLKSNLESLAMIPLHTQVLSFEWCSIGRKKGLLREITRAIPSSVTHLHLLDNYLWCAREELKIFLQSLSPRIQHLNLASNGLNELPVEELIELFQAIPATVTYLNLGGNELGDKTANELAQVLASLPLTITHLDLSGNGLNKISNLSVVFEALNQNLFYLDLSNNSFNPARESKEVFNSLPHGLSELSLASNRLGTKFMEDIISLLNVLPPNLTRLNLGSNQLESKKGDDRIARIFSALPRTIRYLDLNGNNFSFIPSDQLIFALGQLPASIQAVALSFDENFYNLSVTELIAILKSIPVTVQELNFSGNKLHLMGVSPLVSVLSSLPSHIRVLNLIGNGFGKIQVEDLVQIFNAIPRHVEVLMLSPEDINTRSTTDIEALGRALPYVAKVEIQQYFNGTLHIHTEQHLNQHIGQLIKLPYRELNKAMPKVISNLIIEYTGDYPTWMPKFFSMMPSREREKLPEVGSSREDEALPSEVNFHT